MAQSLSLIVPREWGISVFRPVFESIGRTFDASVVVAVDRLDVLGTAVNWYLTLGEDEGVCDWASDYASNDGLPDEFRAFVQTSRLYSVDFNNVDAARELLRLVTGMAVRDGTPAWIDTDYGTVLTAEAVMRNIERNASWDWRNRDDASCEPGSGTL